MKVKMLVFLVLGSVGIAGIALAESSGDNLIVPTVIEKQKAVSLPMVNRSGLQFADKPGVINGAETPDLIPDAVAYSLMFRFISGDQSVLAKQRIRSYVTSFGMEDQHCGNCHDKMINRDIDTIIAAADEYQRRVSVLDSQAEQIKANNPQVIGTEAMAQLTQLQNQKDAMIAEIMASLPRHLSVKALSKLQSHINLRVKPRTKYKPDTFQSVKEPVVNFH
jgi:hypothetical protein